MKQNDCSDVFALLVTHNPDRQELRPTLRAVWNQVAGIVIVDNASSNFPLEAPGEFEGRGVKAHLVRLKKIWESPPVITSAIRQAIARGAKFVLLLDQDSQAAPGRSTRVVMYYRRMRCKIFHLDRISRLKQIILQGGVPDPFRWFCDMWSLYRHWGAGGLRACSN